MYSLEGGKMNPLDYCPKCKRAAVIKGNLLIENSFYIINLSCDNRHEWSVKSESPILEWLGEYDVKGELILDKKDKNAKK